MAWKRAKGNAKGMHKTAQLSAWVSTGQGGAFDTYGGLDMVAQCNCTDLKWLLSTMKVLIRETADLKHS